MEASQIKYIQTCDKCLDSLQENEKSGGMTFKKLEAKAVDLQIGSLLA